MEFNKGLFMNEAWLVLLVEAMDSAGADKFNFDEGNQKNKKI